MADCRWRRPVTWLAVVAIAHGLSPLLLLGLHWWFGVDETVYLSQLNAHVPAGLFTAPRARGTTFLAAPVTLVTTSVAAVRVWLAVLSAVALFLAFRPWLALRRGYEVPVAALLFSTVWSVAYYAFEAMPNEWVAFGVVAATGHLLRYAADGRRRDLVASAAAMAAVARLRPAAALDAGAALVLGCLLLRAPARRRGAAGLAVVVGAALGSADWVIEAYTEYGGVSARITAAQGENGGGGVHFAGAAQLRALAGPLLCRNGCVADAPAADRVWWLVGAALVVAALVADRRRRTIGPLWVPVLVGAAVAGEYVFTVSYAAPRFLIPAYALFALPAAAALCELVERVRGRPARAVAVTACTGLVVVQAVGQAQVIRTRIAPAVALSDRNLLADAATLRREGLRPPCLVLGEPGWNQELAYADGCSNTPPRVAGRASPALAARAVVDLGSGRAVDDRGRRLVLRDDAGTSPLPGYLVRPGAQRLPDDPR